MGMHRYRNYKPLCEEDGWEWLFWPYTIGAVVLTLTLIAGAANAAPIGSYTQSEYNMPLERVK